MRSILFRSDSWGAFASFLCLLHCLITPIIFIASACADDCCESSPGWWRMMDYFFLVISFFAVFRSSMTTSKEWMQYGLWLSWLVLFTVIIIEKAEFIPVSENVKYIAALSLVVLHLYNMRYCQCDNETDKCCAHNE